MNKSRRNYVFIMVAVVLSLSIFSMFGCNERDITDKLGYTETEYFRYYDVHPFFGEIAIIGLTDKGKELEEVIIPNYINHKKVTQLGDDKFDNYFQSDKLKKIVLPYTLEYIDGNFLTGMDVTVMQTDMIPEFHISTTDIFGTGQRYVPYDFDLMEGSSLKAANITYMYDFPDAPNNGVYFIDYVEKGEKIKTIPPRPTGGPGVFDCWWNKGAWDFDNDIPFPLDEENTEEHLILYASWH